LVEGQGLINGGEQARVALGDGRKSGKTMSKSGIANLDVPDAGAY